MPSHRSPRHSKAPSAGAHRHGVARVLSKAGVCSRTEGAGWVRAGRVSVNGCVVLDPEHPVRTGRDRVSVDGAPLGAPSPLYLALNKPRGLVTTARDERGRDTVYRCLQEAGLGWVAPVGRLDKASEGLLLMSNDPVWADRITDPATGPTKCYHVQIDAVPGPGLLQQLEQGVEDAGEHLAAARARLLRHGERSAWLEIELDRGRNRQIRRLLAAHGLGVRRLVRVAIGPIALGALAKGAWRHLEPAEVRALAECPP